MSNTKNPEETFSPAEKSTAVRNIGLLSASQAIAGSNQALVAAVGGLTGVSLASDPAWATVPNTALIIGLAIMAGPASFIIHRLGRRNGFMLGALIAVMAGLFASYAVSVHSFVLFCAALALLGTSAAFGQQYRFAAADSVPLSMKGTAISFVLLGGVLAGFLGPKVGYLARNWIEGAEFAGSFLIVSVLAIIAIGILSFTRLPAADVKNKDKHTGRSIRQLLASPDIFVPVLTGMASYALMTFVMVAAPLAMVYVCGHSIEAATGAIQWHVVAMFAPSFFTGAIIKRIGAHATVGIGLTLILFCAAVNLSGISEWHFIAALVLLGVGWNFGFIGSTALLTAAYTANEAVRAQGLNEQLVFGTMAVASIGSGILLQTIGWQTVNVLVIPIATATIALLAWDDFRKRRLLSA